MMRRLERLALAAGLIAGQFALAPAGAAFAADKAPSTVRIIIAGTLLGSTRVVGDIANITNAYAEVEKEFGTKVEVSAVASGPTATAALVSGSADFGIFSTVEVVKAAVIAQPVVGLMGLSNGGDVLFVTNRKNPGPEGFKTIATFDGARWGVVSIGGIGAAFGGLTAKQAGLDWHAQNIIAGGSDSALAGSLLADRLDITILNIPATASVVQAGQGTVVFDTNGPDARAAWGTILGGTFAGNADFVQKYPELSAAIVRAEVKALLKAKELKDDPKTVYALYPQEYRNALDYDKFAAAWKLYVPTFEHLTGVIGDAEIKSTVELLRKIGQLKEGDQLPKSAFRSDLVLAAYKTLDVAIPSP